MWNKTNRFEAQRVSTKPFTDQVQYEGAIPGKGKRVIGPKWVDDWKQVPSSRSVSPSGRGSPSTVTKRAAVQSNVPPGPLSYHPERAPQFQRHKGALSYAPVQVDIRKAKFPVLPVPGPCTYDVVGSLVKPSFNKFANPQEHQQSEKATIEEESTSRHPILIELDRQVNGLPKTTCDDRRALRQALKSQLACLDSITEHLPFQSSSSSASFSSLVSEWDQSQQQPALPLTMASMLNDGSSSDLSTLFDDVSYHSNLK